MALSEEDITDFKQGVFEVYDEFFSHNVEFLLFDEEKNTTDVYEEKKYKYYKEPINLVGRVLLEVGEEEVLPTGVSIKYDAIFEIPMLALAKDIPYLGRSILALGESLIEKSCIRYEDIMYSIVSFKPMNMVGDVFLIYRIGAKKKPEED